MTVFAVIATVFHLAVRQVAVWYVGVPPPPRQYDPELTARELMPRFVEMLWIVGTADVALLLVLGVVAWKRPAYRLGLLAAFIALVCAYPGIGPLYFVLWNIPFWLVIAGVAAHFAKQPRVRAVVLELAGLAAFALLAGHYALLYLG